MRNTYSKNIFYIGVLLTILLVFTSCNKESNEAVDGSNETWEVLAILSPNGLGDLGYNDNVFYGLCLMRDSLNCRVETFAPDNFTDIESKVKDWVLLPSKANVHRLLVLCDSKCVDLVKKHGWANAENKDILLFDTYETSLPVYTRATLLYGASYVIGRTSGKYCKSVGKHAALFVANNEDWAVREGAAGYLEGAKEEGAVVDTYYLYDEESRGYNMPDSAYHLCYEIAPTTGFVMPLAGSSNNGVYRYGRDAAKNTIFTCSVDEFDFSSVSFQSCWITMDIGSYLLDFAKKWRAGTEQPLHSLAGLGSGYVMFGITNLGSENGFDYAFLDMKEKVIEKETQRYAGSIL